MQVIKYQYTNQDLDANSRTLFIFVATVFQLYADQLLLSSFSRNSPY